MNHSRRPPGLRSQLKACALKYSSRMPPCPCTIAFGRPVVPDEKSTKSGWSNATGSELERRPARTASSSHGQRVRRARARRTARARRAAAWAARRGSSRPRRGGRSSGRGSRSRPTASSTVGSSCTRRSITLRAPSSGAQLAQTAPRLAVAANATTVSGMLGRYATTRSPGPTPSRCESRARTRDLLAELAEGELARGARLAVGDDRDRVGVVVGAHQVLGEVEPRAREPAGAGHLVGREHRAVRRVRLDLEEVPDRRPEPRQVVDGPLLQLLVAWRTRSPRSRASQAT